MLNEQILKLQYEYFYKKVFNEKVEIKKRDTSYIRTFLNLLDEMYGLENLGESFLFDYLTFQFNKYSTAETNMKVQLNWIYGKSAIEKWQKKDENYDYFGNIFRERFNIRNKFHQNESQSISMDYKGREKRRFGDTKRQLLHCSELSLYDRNSDFCNECEMFEICGK
jgi:hypothetical protein